MCLKKKVIWFPFNMWYSLKEEGHQLECGSSGWPSSCKASALTTFTLRGPFLFFYCFSLDMWVCHDSWKALFRTSQLGLYFPWKPLHKMGIWQEIVSWEMFKIIHCDPVVKMIYYSLSVLVDYARVSLVALWVPTNNRIIPKTPGHLMFEAEQKQLLSLITHLQIKINKNKMLLCKNFWYYRTSAYLLYCPHLLFPVCFYSITVN